MTTHNDPQPVNIVALATELLDEARAASSGRAARSVFSREEGLLRQTAIALTSGSELGEHAAPPEARLYVIAGSIDLISPTQTWHLDAGDLVPIPDERHSVTATDDAVFLLTVRRAVSDGVAR